jgi:hypothetical protein
VNSTYWGPSKALTKDQHDAIVAVTGRPITQGPMRPAKPDEDTTESTSVIDRYLTPKGNT